MVRKNDEVYSLYEKIADWYDKNRFKGLMEIDYLNIILKNIPSKSYILDLGCGTGEPIAEFFIKKGHYITGVDAAAAMINLCKQRFPKENWLLEDMRDLHLNSLFDVIIAWDSFFHLNHDDQRKMFKIFERHINPSGLLLFTAGPQHDEVYSKMSGYEFYHASLDTKEYEKLLKEHNFKVLIHKVEDPQCGDHTVWIAQGNEFNFKLLSFEDLEKLSSWFKVDQVKKWYAKGIDFSKKDIELKYRNRIEGKETVPSYIVHLDNYEIGFIQYYSLNDSLPEGVTDYNHQLFEHHSPSEMAGIDLFIGEESYLGKGYGAKIIKAFLHEIVFPKFKVVVIDPNIENSRAIKVYEKVGFKTFSIEKSEQYNETIQLMILKKNINEK